MGPTGLRFKTVISGSYLGFLRPKTSPETRLRRCRAQCLYALYLFRGGNWLPFYFEMRLFLLANPFVEEKAWLTFW